MKKPTNYTALFPDIKTTAETLNDMTKCGSCPIYRWCRDEVIDADEAGHDRPKCTDVFVKWLGSDSGVGEV